jgi:hypothetical protein
MAEKLTLLSERVDDVPWLLAPRERMGIQPLLDEHCPTHGNGVRLSDHPGRTPPAVSSHAPLPWATAHPGASELPHRDLHEALCRFSQTALKMSEP